MLGSWPRVLAISLALVLMAVAAEAATILGPFGGSWDGTESVQTGRILRDGIPSDGTGSKGFPGQFNTSAQLYEVFSFFNNGPEGVVTIDVTVSSVDTHFTAWLGGTYSPIFINNAPNYLGDVGSSVSQPFSILVPANALFLVVASTNSGAASAIGDTFSFTVTGDSVETAAAAVPEPATVLLLGAGLGAIVLRRRFTRRA
ncbi:MAG TPA: PEP-CTERM sorting domain-containing protein [Vicinamibacterales bacterium]|nr:PEP-CTERM sorting domain-containing protein [Vicinamibacterales bacterium]